MNKAQAAGGALAALFAGLALSSAPLVLDEGWVTKVGPDPIGIPTACAGVTGPQIRTGVVYSEDECIRLTAEAMVRHALDIRKCMPGELPTQTRAAFQRFAYNVGAARFCSSTLSRKAMSGDLAGACAELDAWVYAGGRKWRGLVERRSRERRECEAGLRL